MLIFRINLNTQVIKHQSAMLLNDFRLVVSINFSQTACYVIWFGTHSEYDKIKVETVAFDTAILAYKK